MKRKIFCEECLNFRPGHRIPFSYGPPENIREQCMSKFNFKDTHKTEKRLPISEPQKINRFNNCLWFIPRCSSSSSSSSENNIGDEIICDMPY